MELDILLTGGRIYNGEGKPPVKANLGIVDGKIVYPLDFDSTTSAKRKIDVTNLSIAPGFINIHSHSDVPFLVDGRVPSSLCQGITTEVVGNCGSSLAPLLGEYRYEIEKELLRNENIRITWDDLTGYFQRLEEQGISINVISLIGQGALRGSVVGMTDRPATSLEMAKMKELTAQLMKQGAWGISTGLIYPPSSYADTDELVEISKIVAEMGGYYSSHIRGEGDRLLDAIDEALEIGKRAIIPVEIAHLKAAGERNWGKVKSALKMIRTAREKGLNVQHDQYPYTMSSTGLSMILPDWVHDGGVEKFLQRLKDPSIRRRVIEDFLKDPYSNGRDIIISGVEKQENKKYEGRSVDEIAREENKPIHDFIIDLLISEEGDIAAIFQSMCEEDVREVMQDPFTAICTDAWARAADGPLNKGKPHPRTYGSFPRVLGKYSRDEKLLPMSEAIRKMTTLPAQMLGLRDRGRIATGLAADITIFDESRIDDISTIADPHRYPPGIEYVIVNGKIALERGMITSERAGKVLKKEVASGN